MRVMRASALYSIIRTDKDVGSADILNPRATASLSQAHCVTRSPPPTKLLYLKDHFDFDRGLARKRRHAQRGASMLTNRLAEHLGH
ncbi:hypothetical protein AB7M46_005765 [Bradyrhizobium elkanii]